MSNSIDEAIGAICYWIMKRADPEWTKKKEIEYGLREDDQK